MTYSLQMNSRNACLFWRAPAHIRQSLQLPQDALAPPLYSMYCISTAPPSLLELGGVSKFQKELQVSLTKTVILAVWMSHFFLTYKYYVWQIWAIVKSGGNRGILQFMFNCLAESPLGLLESNPDTLSRFGLPSMMDVQDVFITFTWKKKCANIIMSPSSGWRRHDLRLSTPGARCSEILADFPGF